MLFYNHFIILGIELKEYEVIKHTPKGVRINDGSKLGRVVLSTTNKQFAHSTKEKALADLRERNKRHIFVLNRRIKWLQEVNDLVSAILIKQSGDLLLDGLLNVET